MPVVVRMPLRKTASPAIKAGWRGILDRIPVAAYTCDAAGLITYFNPLAETVWGRAPKLRDESDRYCGSFKLYLPDGTRVRHGECWMALALHRGEPYNGREILIERTDGSRTLGLAHANPLRNERGTIIGAVNLVADVTAHKAHEAADCEKTRLTATISHNATLAMIEIGVSLLTGMGWPTAAFR